MIFNLIDDPWIPVRWADGRKEQPLVALSEAFRESPSIAGLACAPHERVALTRLLVCAAQAALGAPPSPHHWHGWGADMAARVPEYLAKWRHRFDLFGYGPRFLQARIPTTKEPVPSGKLVPHFATGNNPTAFDHAGEESREFPSAALALALLTFQAFYPLYGAGYKGKGPCVDGNMVHTILTGGCLAETILLNCLDQHTISSAFPETGRPVWEIGESDSKTLAASTRSYLGRLVPQHRSVLLTDDRRSFHIVQAGTEYPTFEAALEPSATVCVRKKPTGDERYLLPGRLDRSLWRDLHAVVVLGEAGTDGRRAPLVLQSHLLHETPTPWTLWLGSLVTDFKAKILDTLEAAFTLPQTLLSPAGQSRYEQGVIFADEIGKRLWSAVRTSAVAMKCEDAPTDAAQRHYWHALDRNSQVLMALLENMFTPDDPLASGKFGERQGDTPADPWTRAVFAAAESAYAAVCPRATPRQLQAYTAGLRVLRKRPAASKSKAKTPAP